MKQNISKYKKISEKQKIILKKQKNVWNRLKVIKKKVEHHEFLQYYMLNKEGKWIKRLHGGNHIKKNRGGRK